MIKISMQGKFGRNSRKFKAKGRTSSSGICSTALNAMFEGIKLALSTGPGRRGKPEGCCFWRTNAAHDWIYLSEAGCKRARKEHLFSGSTVCDGVVARQRSFHQISWFCCLRCNSVDADASRLEKAD